MAALALGLFGPMQATLDGKPIPKMRSRKALWILAILALREGRPVTRERLAAMLWPDTPTEIGLSNLRPLLSELRSVLGGVHELLQAPDRKTVSLNASETKVDVLEFNAAIARGDLESAVGLYKGQLIEDCEDEWVRPDREAKESACLSALHRLGQAAQERGDFASAVDYARHGVLVAPRKDAPLRGLMERLRASGDLNAALECYRDYERAIREERSGVPDAQTVELYVRLRSEVKSRPHRKFAGSSKVIGDQFYNLEGLVGRENERVELWSKVERYRLITLTGLGGIGKTRLARELANDLASRFTDGACVVTLEAITERQLVVERLAAALRVRPEAKRPLLRTVLDSLQAKEILLVLDNCEHLLEACASLCGHILSNCQGVTILATSRQPLGIAGERVWSVPALTFCDPAALPDHLATRFRVAMGYEATQLFVQRAQAVRDDFELTQDNVFAVAQICALVEGLPLSIELAAARVRSMTPEEIAARLVVHEFGFLGDPGNAAMPRQRTVRATLDWSYNLLSESERFVLQRLSVFRGGWTLEAAEQVVGGDLAPEESVADLLDSLVSKSLINFSTNGREGRFQILETVLQYAQEKLPQNSGIEARLRAWCLAFVERAHQQEQGPNRAAWIERVETEHFNILAVLDSKDVSAETTIALCNSLYRYWAARGYGKACEQYLSEALDKAGDKVDVVERRRAIKILSVAAFERQDFVRSRELSQEAMTLFGEAGDSAQQAAIQSNLSIISLYEGNFVQAKAEAQEAVSFAQSSGEPQRIRHALINFGSVAHALGECQLARQAFEESISITLNDQTSRDVSRLLNYLASVLHDQGQYEEARRLYLDSNERALALKDLHDIAESGFGLGTLFLTVGDFRRAREYLDSSLVQFQKMENAFSVANCLLGLGLLDLQEDQATAARQHVEEGLAIFQSHSHDPGVARSLKALAVVLKAHGFQTRAKEALLQALQIQLKLQTKMHLAMSLLDLAEFYRGEGNFDHSIRCVAIAETLRKNFQWELAPRRQEEVSHLLQDLQAKLGAPKYQRLWAEGTADAWEVSVEALVWEGLSTLPTDECQEFARNIPRSVI